MENFLVPKALQRKSLLSTLFLFAKEKRIGTNRKNPASISWWKRRRKDISNTEYCYSRCWKPWTGSCIGTLFWQRLNHGQKLANYHAVYDVETYKKKRVCVTIKSTEWTNHPSFRFDSSLQRRTKSWSKLPTSTILWTNSRNLHKGRILTNLGEFMFVENSNVQKFCWVTLLLSCYSINHLLESVF